jgi:hypothetical protein
MKDGLSDPVVWRSLVGGYYDRGNAVVVHLSSFSRLKLILALVFCFVWVVY